MIMDAYEDDDLKREWTVNMTRNLNDWELEDKLVWKLKKNDSFMVESLYNHLINIGAMEGLPLPAK